MLERLEKDSLPQKGPHTAAGKEHEEEEAAEGMSYELTAAPIAHPPVFLWGRK